MEHEVFKVNIDGAEVSEALYGDLISLEIELDDDLAAMFRLQIALTLQPDGTWTYLDDDLFAAWKPVTISAGFGDQADEIISGYITHLKPQFGADPTQCTLEIWGMDQSVLMDRVENLQDWPTQKDSDIASTILGEYSFTPQVQDTQIIHDEAISTIIQRETDLQFIKRLALRNGFEFYVEAGTGYFRPPQINAPPQPVLAACFGNETTLDSFSIEVNALAPTNVEMFQIDRVSKQILDTVAQSGQQTALGSTGPDDLLPSGMDPPQAYISMTTTTGNPEMVALSQALYDQAEWFVSAEGEIDGNQYGAVLKPRRTVTIKGIGETYSGLYYVTHVTHSFTTDGYRQVFRAKRNGIQLTGTENFSGSSASLPGS